MKKVVNCRKENSEKPIVETQTQLIRKKFQLIDKHDFNEFFSPKVTKSVNRYDQLSSIYKKIKMKINFPVKKFTTKEESLDYTFFDDSIIHSPRIKQKKKLQEKKENISDARTTLPSITFSNSSIINLKSKSVSLLKNISKKNDIKENRKFIEKLKLDFTNIKQVSNYNYSLQKESLKKDLHHEFPKLNVMKPILLKKNYSNVNFFLKRYSKRNDY